PCPAPADVADPSIGQPSSESLGRGHPAGRGRVRGGAAAGRRCARAPRRRRRGPRWPSRRRAAEPTRPGQRTARGAGPSYRSMVVSVPRCGGGRPPGRVEGRHASHQTGCGDDRTAEERTYPADGRSSEAGVLGGRLTLDRAEDTGDQTYTVWYQ